MKKGNKIDQLRERLKSEDEALAFRLQELQNEYFPKKIKNMSEFAEAQKIKTGIMAVHGIITPPNSRVEHTGAITIEVVRFGGTTEDG